MKLNENWMKITEWMKQWGTSPNLLENSYEFS